MFDTKTSSEAKYRKDSNCLNEELDPQCIRIGMIWPSDGLLEWHAKCLRLLNSQKNVKLVSIIKEALPSQPSRISGITSLILKFFLRKSTSLHPASEPRFLRKLPRVSLAQQEEIGNSCQQAEAEHGTIMPFELDFILNLDLDDPKPYLKKGCRYGVWFFTIGDETKQGMGIPCFRELYHRESTVRACLQLQDDLSGRGGFLEQGSFKTAVHSLARTCDRVLLSIAEWPARVCRRIQSANSPFFIPPQIVISQSGELTLSASTLMIFIIRLLKGLLLRIRQELVEEKWSIGIVEKPVRDLLSGEPMAPISWLPETSRRYSYADPFVLPQSDGQTVLAERYDHLKGRGSICAIRLRSHEPAIDVKVVMDLGIHMSYPCVFEHESETYCVPEIAESRKVVLFRGDPFPKRWKEITVLIHDFAATDSTVFQHGGWWWLLCCNRDDQEQTKLFGWFAPKLFGPWVPHPLNPLKCDPRSSRPAGAPFTQNGCLYRPAQDCSETYGGALVINRIRLLSPEGFSEETMARFVPDTDGPYPAGLHTLCGAGPNTIVDGKRFFYTPRTLLTLTIRILGRKRLIR